MDWTRSKLGADGAGAAVAAVVAAGYVACIADSERGSNEGQRGRARERLGCGAQGWLVTCGPWAECQRQFALAAADQLGITVKSTASAESNRIDPADESAITLRTDWVSTLSTARRRPVPLV